MTLKECLAKLNFPRHLCHHAFNPHFSSIHRMGAGFIIMVFGVLIAKSHEFLAILHSFHLGLDLIGYAVHGIGAAPFIERLLENTHESK